MVEGERDGGERGERTSIVLDTRFGINLFGLKIEDLVRWRDGGDESMSIFRHVNIADKIE